RFEIFLMLQPRLAEMDLTVDHAGQHIQPCAIGCLAGIAKTCADRRDPAADDADIRCYRAARQVNRAAAQDEVEYLGHGLCSLGLMPLFPYLSPMQSTTLRNRALIRVGGADGRPFL